MTFIYGGSDDLLEFEGDLHGEVGFFGSNKNNPIRVMLSDETEFSAYYDDKGIWRIDVINEGSKFSNIEKYEDVTRGHSDILRIDDDKSLTGKYCINNTNWVDVI